ncbi:PqiC family protein [Sphingomonas bacterium]|uniref:PqiC family protein n=1 Tax=Sphingomonas bacterium TaxID=1895847 RepID=UPI0015752AAB|nr:ABC-type transport auxiliary lipoprotein family protein [Sphingomonas bacterium]
MMRRLLPIAVLALAACGHSSATRFWTIEAAPAPTRHPALASPIRIDAVRVPLAIDRLELVRHDAANRVAVLDFDRWSAPPGDLIRRALTRDLLARLPADSVIFPDTPRRPGTRGVAIAVLDLDETDAESVMTVSWSVGDGAPHQLTLHAPLATPDAAGQTTALGVLIGQLADDIVATLR